MLVKGLEKPKDLTGTITDGGSLLLQAAHYYFIITVNGQIETWTLALTLLN